MTCVYIGEGPRSSSRDYRNGYTATRQFIVEGDTTDTNEAAYLVVAAAVSIGIGTAHPENSSAVVLRQRVQQGEIPNNTTFTVTVDYSDKYDQPEAATFGGSTQAVGSLSSNPTDRPAYVPMVGGLSFTSRTETVSNEGYDCEGNPVVNSYGDPLLNYQYEIEITTFQVCWNAATSTGPNEASTFKNKCNNASFTLLGHAYPTHELLCEDYQVKPSNSNGHTYYEKTASFAVAPSEWPYNGTWRTRKVLSKGPRGFDTDNFETTSREDAYGRAVGGEFMLDKDGKIVDPSPTAPAYYLGDTAETSAPFYKKTANFSSMGIP